MCSHQIVKMITDSIFLKGSRHDVCQDYAVKADFCAVGSDGCSGSPNTDVGARILSLSALNLLETGKYTTDSDTERFIDDLLEKVDRSVQNLSINSSALDATLFGFTVSKESNNLYCFLIGDGHVYSKNKDGKEYLSSISFKNNNNEEMPFYLNYWLSPSRRLSYRDAAVQCELVTQRVVRDTEGLSLEVESEVTRDACDRFLSVDHALDEIETFIMFSDGMNTFKIKEPGFEKVGKPLSVKQVLNSITKFNSYGSGFLHRRIKNGIHKDWKYPICHEDDFSAVGFTIL